MISFVDDRNNLFKSYFVANVDERSREPRDLADIRYETLNVVACAIEETDAQRNCADVEIFIPEHFEVELSRVPSA